MIDRMEPLSRWDMQARLLQALASPLRLQLLALLRASGSMTVGELQQRLGIEAANTSQHLAVLRDRGLVTRRREGATVWYAIADPSLHRLLDDARTVIERHTAEAARVAEGDAVGRTPRRRTAR
jgi:DNA-binding transcriptional ArsR family regulator